MKILSAGDAGLIVNAAVRSHANYWESIHEQEDHIMNGKPPFPPEELQKKGAAWCNNRNFGKGRANTEQAVIANVTDILKAFSLMEISFVTFNKKIHKDNIDYFLVDDNLKDIFQEKIAGVFEEALLSTEKLKPFISTAEYNSFLFGYCAISRDIFNFIGKPNHVTHIAFEDRTPVGDIKTWVSFDVIKADMLIKKLADLEGMQAGVVRDQDGGYIIYENGWVKKALEESLAIQINAQNFKNADGSDIVVTSWDDIKLLSEDRGGTWLEKNINNIYVAKIFTKEDDGSFTETYVETRRTTDEEHGDFKAVSKYILYQKSHKNKKFSDFINIIKEFSISSSDFIQDLRGAGKFIAAYSLWFDIKANTIEDKLLLSGSLVFETPNSLINENVKLNVLGAMVQIPEGVKFAPNQVRYDLQDHLQSLAVDKQEYDDSTFHYRPKANLTSRPTKDEVQMVNSQISQQSQNRLPFKLLDYSKVLTNIFIDLVNGDFEDGEQKDCQDLFYDRLTEEFSQFGLEKKDIKKICNLVRSINIHPVIGNVEAINQAMEVAPNPMARKKLLKMLFLSYGFSRNDINILIQEEDYGNELEKAAMENGLFYNTSEIMFTLGQDHITHLNTHFGKIDRVFQNIKGGDDPVKGYNYINNALQNTVKHVEAVKNHPFYKNRFKDFYKIQVQFEAELKVLAQEIQAMQDQAQKQQQDQQQGGQQGQQSLPPDVQQRMYIDRVKALDKIQRTNQQAQANQDRRNQEFEFKKGLQQKQTDAKIDTAKQLAEMQQQIELLKQSAKLQP